MPFSSHRKSAEQSHATRREWIPPIPNQPTNPWQMRLLTLLLAVLAAGPVVLAFQSIYPYVARDHGLLSLLIGLVGAIALAALTAILVGRLPLMIVAIAAAGSLPFSARAVAWFMNLLVHEQALQDDPIKLSGKVVTPYDITPDVFLATVEIAISIGLFVGLIIAMRRDV